MSKILRSVSRFIIKHFFFSFVIFSVLVVVLFAGYKLLFSKQTYVYAKVKVSQGYWWAATQKPSIWYVEALKNADEEKGLRGEPVAKMLAFSYYPWYDTPGQYDAYMLLKLTVTKLGNTGKYMFKRSPLGVGGAIDIEFPRVQVTGTVIQISDKPIQEKYTTKTVYLTKRDAYTKDYPYTYDNIKIGDSFYNGVETIFEILDKKIEPQIWSISNYATGTVAEQTIETNQNIIVKARIKGIKRGDKLIFAEEQVLSEGKEISAATSNYTFRNFIISKIE